MVLKLPSILVASTARNISGFSSPSRAGPADIPAFAITRSSRKQLSIQAATAAWSVTSAMVSVTVAPLARHEPAVAASRAASRPVRCSRIPGVA